MTPEEKLLCAVFKQLILDYIKLDPDSDCSSADFFIDEGDDFKSAENIIFNGVPIYFGSLEITFDQLCEMFSESLKLTPYQLKKEISKKAIEF